MLSAGWKRDYIDSSIACGQVLVFQGNPATSTSLSFATTKTGSTSTDSPKTVKVYNVGNAALSISFPITGTNPAPHIHQLYQLAAQRLPTGRHIGTGREPSSGQLAALAEHQLRSVAVGSNTVSGE